VNCLVSCAVTDHRIYLVLKISSLIFVTDNEIDKLLANRRHECPSGSVIRPRSAQCPLYPPVIRFRSVQWLLLTADIPRIAAIARNGPDNWGDAAARRAEMKGFRCGCVRRLPVAAPSVSMA